MPQHIMLHNDMEYKLFIFVPMMTKIGFHYASSLCFAFNVLELWIAEIGSMSIFANNIILPCHHANLVWIAAWRIYCFNKQ